MWQLIEARLRRRLGLYAWLLLLSWILAAGFAIAKPALREPERISVLAGVISLALAYLAQITISAVDAKESRAALHFALPIPLARLVDRRVIEPVLPLVVFSLISISLAVGLRWMLGGPMESEILLFGVALSVLMIGFSQVHVFAELVQRQMRRRLRWLVAIGVMVAAGLGGVLFGYLLSSLTRAEEGEISFAVELLARPETLSSVFAISLLFASLNKLLLTRRQSFLD